MMQRDTSLKKTPVVLQIVLLVLAIGISVECLKLLTNKADFYPEIVKTFSLKVDVHYVLS